MMMTTTWNFNVSTEVLMFLCHYHRSQRRVANGCPLGCWSRGVPDCRLGGSRHLWPGIHRHVLSPHNSKDARYRHCGERNLLPAELRGCSACGLSPHSRLTYFVVNKVPEQPLPAPLQEFLRFLLSGGGQSIVREQGLFLPLRGWQAKNSRTLFTWPHRFDRTLHAIQSCQNHRTYT